MKNASYGLDGWKLASLALIPIILLITAIVYSLNITTVYNPPFLFLGLNAIFTGLIPLVVAYFALKSYQQHGSYGILFIGAGMLAYGIGSIVAPIVTGLPGGMNLNVTVQNSGALVGAFFQVSGAVLLISGFGIDHDGGRAGKIGLIYGIVTLIVVGVIISAVQGLTPAFYIPNFGYTMLRELVLIGAIEFFVFAAILFYLSYTKKKEEFLFWYSIGIAFIAVGLCSATLVPMAGSPLSWIARFTQYLGGFFIFISVLAIRKSALKQNIPLEEMLSRFFDETEAGYKTLIELASDAIVVFDSTDQVIVWNMAAEKMFGYTSAEATGSSFFQLVIPDEFTGIVKNNFKSPVSPEPDSTLQKSVEIMTRRKDGSTIPVELALSRHTVAGMLVSTCIIRDLTERKKEEDRVQNLLIEVQTEKDRLSSLIASISDEIWFADADKKFTLANPAAIREFGTGSDTIDVEKLAASLEVLRPDGSPRPIDEAPPLRALRGELVRNQEEQVRTPGTSELRWRQVNANPVRDVSGNILGSVSVIRDITDIKMAEKELLQKNEELNVINEELTSTQEELHQNLEELTKREKELQETAEQRQLALDAAQLGWWHYDPITRISRYDKRYREIFSISGEEMPNDEILAQRIHPDDLPALWKKVEAALDPVSPQKYSVEYRIVLPGGIIKWIEAHGEVVFEGIGKNRRATGFSGTVADISEYKFDEDIINLSNEIFRISAASSNLPDMFSGYVKLLHRYTGCKAIGIRILDDEGNIPYQANIGFTEDFLQHESPLSIQFDNCMCINVIKGTTDPSLPFYTEHGSFYINATTKFLATVSEEEKGKTRNMCNKVGYESVALIPIHKGGRILGLLHLADPREGMVPLRTIKILENVALSMGSPILRMNAEEELKFKNESLNKLNENLTSIQEDLREVNDALQENERQLLKKNENLNALNEELTATQEELHQNLEELSLREQELVKRETELKEALSEKEVLLSEIHHRVKNNLTAFISLLSLDGSYEDTESGRALRKDLQNRARSMALIHETLYRTGKFSKVDMGIYLKNLVDQVAQSYNARSDVHVVVEVQKVTLSIDRATTAGLIINELVTNSFKYAFPPGFDCMAVHEVPCMIRVSLANEDGTDVLRVSDNGCGFREGFDPLMSKSLGLKLVNFLSRHQLMADISIQRHNGTEFIFRLKNIENNV